MASPRCTRPRRPTRPLGMDRRPAAARCRQARRRQSGARHCKERREAQAARRSPRASASARRSLDLSLPRQRAPPQPPRAHPTIHSSRRLLPSSKGDPAASEAVATVRVEGRDPGRDAGRGLQTQASGRRSRAAVQEHLEGRGSGRVRESRGGRRACARVVKSVYISSLVLVEGVEGELTEIGGRDPPRNRRSRASPL